VCNGRGLHLLRMPSFGPQARCFTAFSMTIGGPVRLGGLGFVQGGFFLDLGQLEAEAV
jgi:hypothetical protein